MELAFDTPLPASEKRLNLFERYLTVWVTLCMVGGVLLGQSFPGVVSLLRSWGRVFHSSPLVQSQQLMAAIR